MGPRTKLILPSSNKLKQMQFINKLKNIYAVALGSSKSKVKQIKQNIGYKLKK